MKGCKDCPAYAKCTVTYRGSACAALRGTYGIDSDPEIITNADHIRAMSDEELSEFISRIEIGDFGQQVYGKTFCDMCKGQYECDDCRLWWLQQPSGGGHLMDYDKLIERLRTDSLYADKASLEIMDLCMDAATALSTLQAENERLREQVRQL